MTTTMGVSATHPVLSPTSTPGSGGLFRTDPLYSSPAESPRMSGGMINSYIPGVGGGGAAVGNGSLSTNECKMVEVHGVKVASFHVDGQELICLPQVFDLFLKHLVGGLHTVYTKLKRLDISPVVCTVEQVRILRGLGAIQPGVNRCKLISRKDFEILYSDCTNASSSRPGRPPKRALGVGMQESSRLLHHGVHGLLSPSLLAPTGLTAAAMAEAMKLQKMKLMAMNLQGGASQNGTESETEDLNSNTGGSESSWDKEKLQSPSSGPVQHGVAPSGRHGMSSSQISSLQQNHLLANRLELPFMMMPHPLLPVSLPPASVAMAMNQMNHLNTIANMAAAAQIHSPVSRATGSVIKQERVQDSPSPVPSIDGAPALSSQLSSQASSSASNSPTSHPPLSPHHLAQTLPPGFPAPFLFADGISSVETLLTNIQGLLKVAVENARVQEKQIQQEKKELKMELYKEREMRESLERQLSSELHSRATIQKRLKKEKKAKRKLQEALEFESKRREQVEQALQQATSPDTLHINETVIPKVEPEHNGSLQENSATTVQENRSYLKTPIIF
ncbi:dachshund homolog 2-like isoform X7 [Denticeps clupeoides]|uniref:dachshund homolog 2-like isoform X7 n=1 Tax=Denticeps clupeoides TaxID=299321 RepID=UPI0010A46A0E|nr:dachshund homolog 2-like isoform X7 [Denticeps clupeoides]